MKTISIKQPYAHMIVDFPGTIKTPPKRIENRRTLKHIRGTFLVHAGKKFDDEGLAILRYKAAEDWKDPDLVEYLDRLKSSAYPRGGIVGKVDIVGCIPKFSNHAAIKAGWEKQFLIWWAQSQNGLMLDKVTALPFVECRGQQGIFEFDFPFI